MESRIGYTVGNDVKTNIPRNIHIQEFIHDSGYWKFIGALHGFDCLIRTGLPAWAEHEVEQVERVAPGVPAGTDTALPPTAVSEQTSHPIGERLTDFETMEVHHRRYSAAANNMAQLFKQLNQKIQEVSLAAKTFEAKNNSHNRRLLEKNYVNWKICARPTVPNITSCNRKCKMNIATMPP